MPWLWLIAGPNGSGKSTLATGLNAASKGFDQAVGASDQTIWIDPDAIFAEMIGNAAISAGRSPDDVALAAAREADAKVLSAIEDGSSVVRETVLSTDRFKSIVEMAIAKGFQFGLIFVSLASPEECVERVRLRVTLGGHDVPPERTRARWSRSIHNLTWFADSADLALVYDNSALGTPVLLYEKKDGVWACHGVGRIPEIDAAIAPCLTVRRFGL
jgi:predicted ABC-type ATPase